MTPKTLMQTLLAYLLAYLLKNPPLKTIKNHQKKALYICFKYA